MTGMELITVARLGLNPIVIVLNNGSFTSLRSMGHEQAPFVSIPRLDYARLAEVWGGRGFAIDTVQEFTQALHAARASDTFSIVDVRLAADDISPALHHLSVLFAKTLKG